MKPKFTFISAIFIALTCIHAWANDQFQNQALVRLKPGSTLQVFKNHLPAQFKIIASENHVIILQSTSPTLTDQDLSTLKKIPDVKSVYRDSPLESRREDCAECGWQNQERGTPPISKDFRALSQSLSLNSCPLVETCDDSNKSEMLWGQRRMDGDLMLEKVREFENQLKNQGKKIPATRVCVIDSGFDTINQTKNMASPSFEVKSCARPLDVLRGNKVGDTNVDENGHGTGVAGLIGAKDGIGLAPNLNLTVYRISPTNSNEEISSTAFLAICVERIRKNCDVINVSAGPNWEESGDKPEGQIGISTNAEMIEDLETSGTLLVNAAGNNSRRPSSRSDRLDDAVLRIAATNESGSLTDFSTDGELAAPGSSVDTLKSNQSAKFTSKCKNGDASRQRADGTSYAAPLVSAVAGQAKRILKSSTVFQNLGGKSQIALLNRILHASQQAGNVNGLRAVLIAKNWTQQTQVMMDSSELKVLLQKPPLADCEKPASDCFHNIADCSDYQSCFKNSRLLLAACDPIPTGTIESLLDVSSQTPALTDSAPHWYQLRNSNSPDPRALAIWDTLPQKTYRTPTGAKIFKDAIQLIPRRKKRAAQKMMLDVFKSGSILLDEDSKNPSRASQDHLNLVKDTLNTFLQVRGPTETQAAIREWMIDKKVNTPPLKIAPGVFKIMDSLINDSRFESMKPQLLTLDQWLYRSLAQNDYQESGTIGATAQLLDRNSSELQTAAQNFAYHSDTSGLGSAQVEYLVQNPNLISPSKENQNLFYDRVYESINQNKGWPGTNSNLAFEIVQRQIQLKDWSKLENWMNDSKSPEITKALCQIATSKNVPPQLQKQSHLLSRKLALALDEQTKRGWDTHANVLDETVQTLVDNFENQDDPPSDQIFSVPVFDERRSRSRPPTAEFKTISKTDPGTEGALDTLVATILRRASQTPELNQKANLLKNLYKVTHSAAALKKLKGLSNTAQWRIQLAKLETIAEKNRNEFPPFLRNIIADFKAKFLK